MTIDDFLKRFVEGYLFHDLESLSKITLPTGQNDGAAGYPMVATTLAGMELLGSLLMPTTDAFDPKNKSNDYFLNYWDNYLSKGYAQYTGLGRLFRQLMRNGIAHTFVAKPGIFVEKGSNRQMSIDTTRQEIYIDCNVFFKEFEDTYWKLVKPIVDGTASSPATTKANVQTKLDDISRVYSVDSIRLFGAVQTLHASTINTGKRAQVPVSSFFSSLGTRASGASGSAMPVPTTTIVNSSSTATIPPSVTVPFTTISDTFPQTKK